MVTCDICNRQVDGVILHSSIHNRAPTRYCENCWYNKNEPILVLTKLWSSPRLEDEDINMSNLFSPKLGKNVFPAKNQMKKCGFRLFNKKVFFKEKSNERYREVLIYKYNGPLRCLALNEYTAWPSRMKKCCKIGCNLY